MNSPARAGLGQALPVAVAGGGGHAHVYLHAGPAAADGSIPSGMRGQLEALCRNAQQSLAAAGASFADVVRHTIYTLDIDEYIRCVDVRFRYFSPDPPADTLLQVARLGAPAALVEMELEAVIEWPRPPAATTPER